MAYSTNPCFFDCALVCLLKMSQITTNDEEESHCDAYVYVWEGSTGREEEQVAGKKRREECWNAIKPSEFFWATLLTRMSVDTENRMDIWFLYLSFLLLTNTLLYQPPIIRNKSAIRRKTCWLLFNANQEVGKHIQER